MEYSNKLSLANKIIEEIVGGPIVDWNDLPDINSLHDCEDEVEIRDACIARLEEGGFPFDEREPEEPCYE